MAKKSAEELQAENDALRAAAEKANAALPIEGSFEAKWKNLATNKEEKRKVAFVDGHKYLFVAGEKLRTELVLKLANGQTLSQKEKPLTGKLTKEGAIKHLTHLAKIGYAYLK